MASPSVPVKVDVPKLFRLWNTPGISINQVAAELGLSLHQLRKARDRYGLSEKPAPADDTLGPGEEDPTEEQIAERAAEIRSKWPAWRLEGRGSSDDPHPLIPQLSYDGRNQAFRQRIH